MQYQNKPKYNKDSTFYICSGILLFVLIIGCLLLAFKSKDIISLINKTSKKGSTNSVVSNNSVKPVSTTKANSAVTPTKITPKLSPKDSYLKMKPEADNLKTFDDYVAYVNKYGSKSKIREVQNVTKQAATLPPGFKERLISTLKSITPTAKDLTTIKESITNDTATLTISTNKPELKGTVNLILEEGVWKFDHESWQQEVK